MGSLYRRWDLAHTKETSQKESTTLKVKRLKSPITIGIQVMSGVKRNFSKNLGLRAEIKFRDPIVDVESQFKSNTINYNGYIISVDPTPFQNKSEL
jgi:hypothetical protein